MWDLTTILLFIVVFLLVWLYRSGRIPKGMPPGPPTWPFIGNLDMIHSSYDFHVTSTELGRKHNGVFSFQYGLYPGIIITDYALAKETFVEKADIYSDRTDHLDWYRIANKMKETGVVHQNGETWRQIKKLTMSSFRDFGVGKSTIEHRIQEETAELISHISAKGDGYFTLGFLFNLAVTNVISAVLFDKRYAYDDQMFIKQIEYFNFIVREAGGRNIFQYLPWWTFISMPIVKPETKLYLKYADFVRNWIKTHVQDHRETFDKTHLRDFIDLYLNTDPQENDKALVTDKLIFNTIFELFGAGSETTATTLLWAIIYLTKHPEIQEKCRQEIRQKVGDRQLTYSDKNSLPYLQATIWEIQRRGNIVPMTLAHKTSKATHLAGYKIPRNTVVNVNTYAIHMDPLLWDDPEAFKPERFLDEEGHVTKPEAFLPFGLGRRACLGESLANIELWLFLAELLQKFEFEAENPSTLPTPETSEFGVTLIPGEFYVKTKRIV